MPAERHSLVRSIRLTGSGFSLCLRVERHRSHSLETLLDDGDVAERAEPQARTEARLASMPALPTTARVAA